MCVGAVRSLSTSHWIASILKKSYWLAMKLTTILAVLSERPKTDKGMETKLLISRGGPFTLELRHIAKVCTAFAHSFAVNPALKTHLPFNSSSVELNYLKQRRQSSLVTLVRIIGKQGDSIDSLLVKC